MGLHHFRLERAGRADVAWLARTLTQASGPLGHSSKIPVMAVSTPFGDWRSAFQSCVLKTLNPATTSSSSSVICAWRSW